MNIVVDKIINGWIRQLSLPGNLLLFLTLYNDIGK